ncbi:MAG: 3-oxoacyl-[acyl-carrier-protein] synthase III C-terminal domain-containing protein, partial [Pseudomonadota bacterium]
VLPGFLQRLFAPMDYTMADMDMVIPHQASLMSMRLLRSHLNIPKDALMVIAHNHGNTVAASIPMALHEAIQQGKVKRGDRVLLLGTAAGFSAGGIVLIY